MALVLDKVLKVLRVSDGWQLALWASEVFHSAVYRWKLPTLKCERLRETFQISKPDDPLRVLGIYWTTGWEVKVYRLMITTVKCGRTNHSIWTARPPLQNDSLKVGEFPNPRHKCILISTCVERSRLHPPHPPETTLSLSLTRSNPHRIFWS
jgi:hypothetical protein